MLEKRVERKWRVAGWARTSTSGRLQVDQSACFSGGAEGGRDREVQERPQEAPRRDDVKRRGQVKTNRRVYRRREMK